MDRWLGIVLQFLTAFAMSLMYGFMITYLVLWGRAMPEHAYFMLVFISVFSTVVALIIAGIKQIYYLLTGAANYQQMRRTLNRAYLKFPIPQLIGFLLMVNYVLAGFGSPHVSGILQAVLTQGSIPFTIVMSYVLLGRRYGWLQLGGAAVVIGGALLSMEQDFAGAACSNTTTFSDFEVACYRVDKMLPPDATSACVTLNSNSIIWDLLYFVSTMPMGLVNIIMEYFLQYSKGSESNRNKYGELNIPICVALNNFWLFIWLILFFWLNLLPQVVPQCTDVAHSLSVFGLNMRTAMECTFSGHGGFRTDGNLTITSALHQGDDCDHAFFFVMMLALAATFQMILQAYTVQQHSATFTMALVTLGPMFAVAFQNSETITTHIYYSEVKTDFSTFMVVGLVVVLTGILMYKTPSFLRYLNLCSALHPIETDDSDSRVHRWLSPRVRQCLERSLQFSKDGATDLQGLTSGGSVSDQGETCLDYCC